MSVKKDIRQVTIPGVKPKKMFETDCVVSLYKTYPLVPFQFDTKREAEVNVLFSHYCPARAFLTKHEYTITKLQSKIDGREKTITRIDRLSMSLVLVDVLLLVVFLIHHLGIHHAV